MDRKGTPEVIQSRKDGTLQTYVTEQQTEEFARESRVQLVVGTSLQKERTRLTLSRRTNKREGLGPRKGSIVDRVKRKYQ